MNLIVLMLFCYIFSVDFHNWMYMNWVWRLSIYISRDGVSESQFVQVLNIELDQIIEVS